eukprot:CAMPEP_0203886332 /NCGR_PEP_ID=MMETSP0359-20131031/30153_1 /ASSEMBLY_ACC=CAM_ASM_000338 /TAXON_ID=268821 /ORGANISM="Scrippsiella Hangoei, Strain SHTV-5" /LENGTH=746 /DNA_ID=CAMNT_0050807139 /DNA_START=136 /DNA_END=2373 /DNA_ORIENTATION=+
MVDQVFRELAGLGRDAKADLIGKIMDSHLGRSVLDQRTASDLLSKMGTGRRTTHLVEVLGCLQQRGLEHTLSLGLEAIKACRQSGEWGTALAVLQKVLANQVELDTFAYNAAVGACAKGGAWTQALGLLAQMASINVDPDAWTYGPAVGACAKHGEWVKVLGLLADMADRRVELDTIACNTVVSACTTGGEWAKALWLLAEMTRSCVVSDNGTYWAAVSACRLGEKWIEALWLCSEMVGRRASPDILTVASAMSVCGKAGEWAQAVGLLARLLTDQVELDTITWNTAISACESVGEWIQALTLLSEMEAGRVDLDTITFNGAVSACAKGGEWAQALGLLAEMTTSNVELNTITFNSAVNACVSGGEWGQALGLLAEMKAGRVHLDTLTFNAAVVVCAKGGEWVRAVGLLAEMRALDLKFDDFIYNSVINSFEQGATWQQSLAFYEEFRLKCRNPGGMALGSVINACRSGNSWTQACLLLDRELNSILECEARHVTAPHKTVFQQMSAKGGPDVLLQTEGVLALLKTADMSTESILEQLCQHLPSHGSGVMPVSRLDFQTSGVLIVALRSYISTSADYVQAQFAGRLASKTYHCLCSGQCLGSFGSRAFSSAPLSKVEVDNSWRAYVSVLDGQEACTSLLVKACYRFEELRGMPEELFMFLEARPITGRTHQIRIHLASLGRPLVADSVYGSRSAAAECLWCPRVFLHCSRVTLRDVDGSLCRAEAELTPDLLRALQSLRKLHVDGR